MRTYDVPDLERSVDIAASAEDVYAMVSDLTRMHEWSPETTSVSWRRGATGPTPGAHFIGLNKSGAARWATQGVIVVAEPPSRFRFDISFGPLPISIWEYDVTARGDASCTVTERWTDVRPALFRAVADRLIGSRRRANERGIEATLDNLRRAAESA